MLLSWKKKKTKPKHNPPSCPNLCQHNLKHSCQLLIDFHVKTQAGCNLGLASRQRLVWLVPQPANVLCLSLSHSLFFSSQGVVGIWPFHHHFSLFSAMAQQHCGHTEVLTHLPLCLSGVQTLLSSALPAAAVGADLQLQGTQRAQSGTHVPTQQPWNNRDTAFMEKHCRVSTTANHFTVFHKNYIS